MTNLTLQELTKFTFVQVRKPAQGNAFWATLEFSTVMAVGYGDNPELALNMAYNSFLKQIEESYNHNAKDEFCNV